MDNVIYKVLTDKNMTQAELARKVGVKREYINRIINRKITPTIPLGMRIAKALGKRVEDIFIVD
jgi:putative transcriptional regulator